MQIVRQSEERGCSPSEVLHKGKGGFDGSRDTMRSMLRTWIRSFYCTGRLLDENPVCRVPSGERDGCDSSF